MVVRFRKKVRRMRGSKSHGYGGKKKHRGAGSRGGRGMSGLMKHKKSWMLKYDPKHFGRVGFKIPRAVKKEIKSINLKDIDNLASASGKTELELSALGYQKVLSAGRLTRALTIKAGKFTGKAKEKIEKAGGKAISE